MNEATGSHAHRALHYVRALGATLCLAFAVQAPPVRSASTGEPPLHWYRGNTHTHTLNSDGDESPDVVAHWYRAHGYQFLVITDHEYLTDVEGLNRAIGAEDQFLLMRGEEVTQEVSDPSHPEGIREVHVNGINLQHVVHALGQPYHEGEGRLAPKGTTVAEVLTRNIAEIQAAGGLAQVNHPNFRWSLRIADMTELPDGILFEIWNGGHDPINNLGGVDAAGNRTPSAEEMWDALLSQGKHIWAVGSDDSHQYHDLENINSMRPGLAWVVVRADRLTPDAITAALARGDFYDSTGVELDNIRAQPRELAIAIHPPGSLPNAPDWKSDTRYLTRFIGKKSRLLAEVGGLNPRYAIHGDEGFVRARITDSNGRQAWTQPTFVRP
jgi:hypothetical protein